MGTVFVGNPLSLNPDSWVLNWGTNGLSGKSARECVWTCGDTPGPVESHNFIESDSSNTRNNLYVTRDCATLDLELFAAGTIWLRILSGISTWT